MKPIGAMTRVELAGFVSAEFQKNKINVVPQAGNPCRDPQRCRSQGSREMVKGRG
jgi:hypothetical protein